jgi:triacylglycerol esterase/lipase EstA (alpha/beta hydrolase family)
MQAGSEDYRLVDFLIDAALLGTELYLLGIGVYVLLGVFGNRLLRGLPIRPEATVAAMFLRELAAMLVLLPGLMFGLYQPDPPRGPTGERNPVLLVHGFGLNRICFFLLERFLLARGFPVVWSVNHRPINGSIPEMARELGQRIEELRMSTGAKQVDVVAHSMGGVITAWYAERLEGAASVRRLITLGTPWRGTLMAGLWPKPSCADMTPSSEVIEDIQSPTLPVVALWSAEDNVILPAANSRLEGRGKESWDIQVDNAGHTELLFRPSVWRAVAASLLADRIQDLPRFIAKPVATETGPSLRGNPT